MHLASALLRRWPPLENRANGGPDREVDGWYYNLGVTGMRAELSASRPKHLLIRHVFSGSPADRQIQAGDYIVGVSGKAFETAHQNGYGEAVFGAKGPILDFANALESAQSISGKGQLTIDIDRHGQRQQVVLNIGQEDGAFGETFPTADAKSAQILEGLYSYLKERKGKMVLGVAHRTTRLPLGTACQRTCRASGIGT